MTLKKYRIVIDTNVLVSAIRSSKGAAFKLLLLIRSGMFDFILSTPLVLEYEMVLKRSGIVALTSGEIDELLDILCAIGLHQKSWYLWQPILSDAGDDFIAELAANSQADFIVTYNKKHFDSMRTFGVNVCSPIEFLKLLGL